MRDPGNSYRFILWSQRIARAILRTLQICGLPIARPAVTLKWFGYLLESPAHGIASLDERHEIGMREGS
jgi:hypothetical protein